MKTDKILAQNTSRFTNDRLRTEKRDKIVFPVLDHNNDSYEDIDQSMLSLHNLLNNNKKRFEFKIDVNDIKTRPSLVRFNDNQTYRNNDSCVTFLSDNLKQMYDET